MGMARRDEFISRNKKRTGPRNLSIETRKKMSLAASKRNSEKVYTKGIGGTRTDIGHYVRSRWEANIARWLKYIGKIYMYEEHIFELKYGLRTINYKPDFYLPIQNKFYEVKGWWNERSMLIKQLFKEQYPNIILEYIDEKEYLEIQKNFQQLIPNWECKEGSAHGRQ